MCPIATIELRSGVSLLLKYWAPVLAWMTLMFRWSSDQMSAEHTSRFFAPFLHWLWPNISGETIILLHILIRKAAHVTEYTIVAILLARLFDVHLRQKKISTILMLSFAAAVLFAMGDEFHQSFVPSRTASPIDVGIDSVGALAGLMIYRAGRLHRSKA